MGMGREEKDKQKLELLAPAGSFEILKGVVDAGADAVYFGGDRFSARSYAPNFTPEEGKQAIAYAHLRGCKSYLTVNTLLKNREIEEKLYGYLKYYYENGIDAVIVQDFGVFSLIRDCFPQLPVHASTQMTVAEGSGANFLHRLGAARVVLARELSLEEIGSIHAKCPVELEVFVHGALCYCYSGQCLMSSMIGGRSGNRGRCAQPCRLPYTLLDERQQKINLPGDYLLSLKDLCAIKSLPQLVEAGVTSLKIEGRMKQLSYAAGVVSVYRRYVDAYFNQGAVHYAVAPEDMRTLYDLGNRSGFTDDYLKRRNSPSMVTFKEPSHRQGEPAKTAVEERRAAIGGRFTAAAGQPISLSVWDGCGHEVTLSGAVPAAAEKRAITGEMVQEKLQKTGATPFYFSRLDVQVAEGIFLPMSSVNELRRRALEQLASAILAKPPGEMRPYEPCRTPDTPCHTPDAACTRRKCYVTVVSREQFDAAVAAETTDIVGITVSMALNDGWDAYKTAAKAAGKRLYLILPPVLRKDGIRRMGKAGMDSAFVQAEGVMAASYDALGYLDGIGVPRERIVLDHRLYTFSDQSGQAFEALGYRRRTAPLELNAKELSHRYNGHDFLVVYGRYPLMTAANCVHAYADGCRRREQIYYLKDRRQEKFPVRNDCNFCYNVIDNSRVTCLFDQMDTLESLGFYGYRLDFTTEDAAGTKQALRDYDKMTVHGASTGISTDCTKGHWKRGVK